MRVDDSKTKKYRRRHSVVIPPSKHHPGLRKRVPISTAILEKQIVTGVPMRHTNVSSFRLALKYLAANRQESTAAAARQPRAVHMLEADEFAALANSSLRVQLADRLAAAMWAIEEALAICELEDIACRDTSWIEPDLRHTYDQVNDIMKTITN